MPISVDEKYEGKVSKKVRKIKGGPPDPMYAQEADLYNLGYPKLGRDNQGEIRPKFSKGARDLIEGNRTILTEKGYRDVIDGSIEAALACGKKTVSKDSAAVALNIVTRCGESRVGFGRSTMFNVMEDRDRRAAIPKTQKQITSINKRRVAGGKTALTVVGRGPKLSNPVPELAALQAGSVLHYIEDGGNTREKKDKRVASFYNQETANGMSWADAAVLRLTELEAKPRTQAVANSYNKLEANLTELNNYNF